jgi:hypothetical protein
VRRARRTRRTGCRCRSSRRRRLRAHGQESSRQERKEALACCCSTKTGGRGVRARRRCHRARREARRGAGREAPRAPPNGTRLGCAPLVHAAAHARARRSVRGGNATNRNVGGNVLRHALTASAAGRDSRRALTPMAGARSA